MKGCQQLLGLGGVQSKYFCMFCLATNARGSKVHSTSVAGLPCLANLPPEWKEKDQRTPEVANPPLREGTERMAQQAALFKEARATDKRASAKSFESCMESPLIQSNNLLAHVTGTPLHISLGLGTNLLNKIEHACKELDMEVAAHSNHSGVVISLLVSEKEIFDLEKELGEVEDKIQQVSSAMLLRI